MVAQMIRTSTVTSSVPPTGLKVRSWIARRSFTWMGGVSSPISSRKSVPSWAASKRPILFATAPVNEPFLCPNSSLSIRFSGIAPQLIVTNGLSLRGLL